MEITSVYTVTDYKTGKSYEEFVNGAGEETIKFLRKEYPKFSKFVLDGFEIDGEFKQLNTFLR